MRWGLWVPFVWLAMACATGSPDSREAEESRGRDEIEQTDVEDCVRSLCGCWEPVTLVYEVRATDIEGAALPGLELVCLGEEEPVAVSDENGRIAFSIETEYSPGCRYARCMNLLFHDPEARVPDRRATVFEGEDGVLVLGGAER